MSIRKPDGHSQVVRELNAGDYFGEMAIKQAGVRTATVQAVKGPVNCLKLVRGSWFAVVVVVVVVAAAVIIPDGVLTWCDLGGGMDRIVRRSIVWSVPVTRSLPSGALTTNSPLERWVARRALSLQSSSLSRAVAASVDL